MPTPATTSTKGETQSETQSEMLTVVLDVYPRSAHAMLAKADVAKGETYAGPWPRHLDVEAGNYRLVVFRAGFKTVVREIMVTPKTSATVLRIQLLSDDDEP